MGKQRTKGETEELGGCSRGLGDTVGQGDIQGYRATRGIKGDTGDKG